MTAMMRGMTAVVGLVLVALDPAISPPTGDFDVVRYAITQGGLLAVVLVLLWTYRRDLMRQMSDKNDRIAVMTDIVQAATTALTRYADACDRMARAVENLERGERRH
jgi:hypothetical protein